MTTPKSIDPVGLEVPDRSLSHSAARRADDTQVAIADGKAALRRRHRHACADGCCPPSDAWSLIVPCDELPHCHYCECGSVHTIRLEAGDVAAIKALLP